MQKGDDLDFSEWATITEEDLALLARLKEFLDEQQKKKEAEWAFHSSVWDAALDATEDPLFAREPNFKRKG